MFCARSTTRKGCSRNDRSGERVRAAGGNLQAPAGGGRKARAGDSLAASHQPDAPRAGAGVGQKPPPGACAEMGDGSTGKRRCSADAAAAGGWLSGGGDRPPRIRSVYLCDAADHAGHRAVVPGA